MRGRRGSILPEQGSQSVCHGGGREREDLTAIVGGALVLVSSMESMSDSTRLWWPKKKPCKCRAFSLPSGFALAPERTARSSV